MEHPDLKILIQHAVHEDYLREAERRRRNPRRDGVNPIRELAGRALISIGTRIAERPRPIGTPPAMGEISLAGRIDS